jgi:hypothetical protein
LLRILLLTAVVPLSLLIVLDILAGLLPLLTILGLLIFIPAGSFFIVRASLDEFSRVIDEAAPVLDGAEAGADDEAVASQRADVEEADSGSDPGDGLGR